MNTTTIQCNPMTICTKKHTRATPPKMMKYIHKKWWSTIMYYCYTNSTIRTQWIAARIKIGKNLLTNRLSIINDNKRFELLNSPFASFKLKCKQLFLSWKNLRYTTIKCCLLKSQFLKSQFFFNVGTSQRCSFFFFSSYYLIACVYYI